MSIDEKMKKFESLMKEIRNVRYELNEISVVQKFPNSNVLVTAIVNQKGDKFALPGYMLNECIKKQKEALRGRLKSLENQFNEISYTQEAEVLEIETA